MAVTKQANIATINLGNSETLTLSDENELGIRKLSVRPPASGTTTITGTLVLPIASSSFGGDGITLTSSDSAITFIAIDGETLQGITIANDASAECAIIAYK